MLKFKINILEELKQAGFSSYRLRNEKILAESTIQKLRTGDANINPSSLNVICDLLDCQPGDLLEFVPDD